MGDLGSVAIHKKYRSNRGGVEGVQEQTRSSPPSSWWSNTELQAQAMAGAAARTSDEDWKRGIELGHRNRTHQRSNPKGKNGRNRTRTAGRMAWR